MTTPSSPDAYDTSSFWSIKLCKKARLRLGKERRGHEQSKFDTQVILKLWQHVIHEIVRSVRPTDLLKLRRTSKSLKHLCDLEISKRIPTGDFWLPLGKDRLLYSSLMKSQRSSPNWNSYWDERAMNMYFTSKSIYMPTPNEINYFNDKAQQKYEKHEKKLWTWMPRPICATTYYLDNYDNYNLHIRDNCKIQYEKSQRHLPDCPRTHRNTFSRYVCQTPKDARFDVLLNPKLLLKTGEYRFWMLC